MANNTASKHTDTPSPRPARHKESPDGSLVSYFRDMTGTALLTPEREVSLSRQIEDAEIELWAALLSHPAALPQMLELATSLLGNSLPEFRNLRAAATRAHKARTKASAEALLVQ